MRRRANPGFTLVEMMVAIAILAMVTAGVMESFVVQNRAYTVVDQSTESQQNLRAVASLLERDLRMTGFMVPEGAAVCGVDRTTGPDTLYVTDHDAIDPTGQGAANLGARILSGYSGSATLLTLSLAAMTLDGQPVYDTGGAAGPDADFRPGGGVIVMDRANPDRGTACGTIIPNGITASTIRVDFETGLGAGGGTLVAIPAHRYSIPDPVNGLDDDGNLIVDDATLVRDGTPIVTDVDDFQVAYFIDADDDGDDEGGAEWESQDSSGAQYQSPGTDHSELREVRVNLVLRSRNADPEWTEGTEQVTENRAPTGVTDGFRRRVLTTTTKPRNVGFRGQEVSG